MKDITFDQEDRSLPRKEYLVKYFGTLSKLTLEEVHDTIKEFLEFFKKDYNSNRSSKIHQIEFVLSDVEYKFKDVNEYKIYRKGFLRVDNIIIDMIHIEKDVIYDNISHDEIITRECLKHFLIRGCYLLEYQR